jgi:hypothetical protein
MSTMKQKTKKLLNVICPNCELRLELLCRDEKGSCFICNTCGYWLYVENDLIRYDNLAKRNDYHHLEA